MYLEIDGERINGPSWAQVRAAVPDGSVEAGWVICLGRSKKTYLEAEANGEGRFDLAHNDEGKLFASPTHVDAVKLRDMLEAYFSGDQRWRAAVEWSPIPTGSPPPAAMGMQASAKDARGWDWRWLLLAIPFLYPVIEIIQVITGWRILEFVPFPSFSFDPMDIPLPAMFDSVASRMFLILFVAVLIVFLIAAAVKWYETKQASRWPSVTGVIIRSQRGIALKQTVGNTEMPVDEPIADIAYRYSVGGKEYVGKRLSLAERIGENEIDGMIALYPVGRAVKVFYRRSDPSEALLDREAPKGVLGGCLLMLLFGLAALLIMMWVFTNGGDYIKTVLPNSNPPIMIIPTIVGFGFLIAFLSLRKDMKAAERFPRVPGKVTAAEIFTFESRGRHENGRRRGGTTMHRPLVTYKYTVDGQTYVNRRVNFGTDEAGSRGFAQKVIARYPVGKAVEVIYDPKNPQQSGLELRYGWIWFALLAAAIAFAVALPFTGIFGAIPMRTG